MKIEVELGDIEILRKQIQTLEEEKEGLYKKLSALDEKQLKADVRVMAQKMTDSIMAEVFKKLGFKAGGLGYMSFKDLEHWHGKEWWTHEDLEVTLSATITNQFKSAFLSLGVKTNTDKE